MCFTLTSSFTLALTLYRRYGSPHFTDEDTEAQETSSDLLFNPKAITLSLTELVLGLQWVKNAIG